MHGQWMKTAIGAALMLTGAATLVLNACSSDDDNKSPTQYKARAEIKGTTAASQVKGEAIFTQEGDETTVVITVENAGAAGERGLHIHQGSNCDTTTSDAGTTPGGGAGGHWNPSDAGHGYPGGGSHHIGDLGNIEIKADGTGSLTHKTKVFQVREGATSVVGHAIIFHERKDDGVSQPVGNAGARPGCGVIVQSE